MHSKKYTFVDEHVCFSRIRTSEFFVCAQDFLILLWHQSSSLETFCLDICLLLGGLLMGGELRLLIRTCLISIEEHLLIGDEVRMLLGLVYWWQRVYPFLQHSKFRELPTLWRFGFGVQEARLTDCKHFTTKGILFLFRSLSPCRWTLSQEILSRWKLAYPPAFAVPRSTTQRISELEDSWSQVRSYNNL